MIYFLFIVLNYIYVIFSDKKIPPFWYNLYPHIFQFPPSSPEVETNNFNINSKLDDKELIIQINLFQTPCH